MVQITLKGNVPLDPRQRVLAIEAAVEALCRSAGEDPADAVMTLLTAAAHICLKQTGKGLDEITPTMAECLGAALMAADGFFTLRDANA
ncbi:hypothetical protein [Devosia sp. 2618]|uniref:hypothetical protein n=1 Tax=Devosia sp. 2618 TaxID=3156454 RepID=UPI003398590C